MRMTEVWTFPKTHWQFCLRHCRRPYMRLVAGLFGNHTHHHLDQPIRPYEDLCMEKKNHDKMILNEYLYNDSISKEDGKRLINNLTAKEPAAAGVSPVDALKRSEPTRRSSQPVPCSRSCVASGSAAHRHVQVRRGFENQELRQRMAIPWAVTLPDALAFAIIGSGDIVIAVTFREGIRRGVVME